MKRITIILLLICYLIPSIGLSVTTHYCGGKLASISILNIKSPTCRCGKKPMKKGCCKDKATILKIKDTQQFSKQVSLSASKTFTFQPLYSVLTDLNSSITTYKLNIPFAHPPPLQKSEPLYLLNRVFLI